MILTPHIGGSTLEAQKSIGHFVSQRLEDYWVKGSTMLSVNLPQVTLGPCIRALARIAHLHANLPGVLARVNRVLGEDEHQHRRAVSRAPRASSATWSPTWRSSPDQTALDALSHHRGHDSHARDQLNKPVIGFPHGPFRCSITRKGVRISSVTVDVGIDINIDSCQCSFDQRSSASALLRFNTVPFQCRSASMCFSLRRSSMARWKSSRSIEILVHAGESQVGDHHPSSRRRASKCALPTSSESTSASPRDRRSSSTRCPSVRQIVFVDRPALAGLPSRRTPPSCGRTARRFRNA